MSASLKEEKLQQFWELSRQWNGFGSATIGELLEGIADLAGSFNNLGWVRAENTSAKLLDQVINNKRCRKRKPINNIVRLMDHRVVQPRVLMDIVRADGPDAIVGQTFILQITKAG